MFQFESKQGDVVVESVGDANTFHHLTSTALKEIYLQLILNFTLTKVGLN